MILWEALHGPVFTNDTHRKNVARRCAGGVFCAVIRFTGQYSSA